MNFFKNKRVAIAIALVIIILSSIYGITKRPTENSANDPQTGNIPGSEQRETETPAASETPVPVDEAYDLGKRFYEAGEYSRAITELQKVQDSSFYYANAQTLLIEAANGYRAEILQTAGSYAEQREYTIAINILENALLMLPNDSELQHISDEYRSAYKSVVRTEAIEQADMYIAENDYANAIKTVDAVLDKIGYDDELTALYNKYIGEYKDFLISEANKAYHTTGYEDAVSILKEGLHTLGNEENILSLISQYEACAPINFYALTNSGSQYYYSGDPHWNYSFTNSVYDTSKIQRNNVIYSMVDEPSTRLYVNREFVQISGTLFFRLDCNDDYSHYTFIRIYGDGDLLYEKSISNTDDPQYFEVDISDVIFLDVEIYTGYISLSGYSRLFGGVSELNLYKNVM